VQLDKGTSVRLSAEQARHIEHGYAVANIKAGAPERVIFTQNEAVSQREISSLVSVYNSDGSGSNNQAIPNPLSLNIRSKPRQTSLT
jgi:hypothetical protein